MDTPERPTKRFLLYSLGTVVAFFFFFKTTVDMPQLAHVIGRMHPPTLVLAILLILPTPLLSSLRWFAVLRASGHSFSLRRITRITVASMTFISIPGRIGDFIRCYPLRHETRFSGLIATIIAEKIIDIAVLCFFSAIGLTILSHISLALVMLVLGLTALVTISLIRFIPLSMRSTGLIENLRAAAQVFIEITRRPLWLALIIAVSALNWATSLLSTWLLFRAAGTIVPLSVVFSYLPLAIFAGLIPFGLAGTGTRDATFLALFAPFAPSAVILATSIGYTVLGYLLLTLIGIPFLRSLRSESPIPTESV